MVKSPDVSSFSDPKRLLGRSAYLRGSPPSTGRVRFSNTLSRGEDHSDFYVLDVAVVGLQLFLVVVLRGRKALALRFVCGKLTFFCLDYKKKPVGLTGDLKFRLLS